ncbi:MAG TPA: hypothetical protein VN824_12450, partial [Puia sp.]|nr:hypothetical protein [Puia sp.]
MKNYQWKICFSAHLPSRFKKLSFYVICLLIGLPDCSILAQPWILPDASNNIHNTNTGNIGIGITTPQI